MRKLYWRPQRVSLRVLALLSFLSLCSLLAVESFRVRERQPLYPEKMRAAQTCLRAFKTVKAARLHKGIPINPEVDPAETGLIGELLSPITTNTGHAGAKQTSANPNFAAVIVELLRRAHVETGDTVAVGVSGSFPALNIAVLSAVETLELRALVIASVGSSQWGANNPDFTWLDMERLLREEGIFSTKPIAVSPGGVDDRAVGISPRGKELLMQAVDRSGIPLLEPKSYADGLDRRMALYREQAGESEIRAYINVGGGTISVGTRVGKHMFKPGLNRSAPRGPTVDSVMARFAERGVPVIHLIQLDYLAERYGLPIQPQTMPPAGEGTVFQRKVYNRWLAGGALVLIFVSLIALLRFDLGYRLLGGTRSDTRALNPEPMV